jgi:hypothetical protein
MSMLNFYINRAGRTLTRERRDILERTKGELRKVFGRGSLIVWQEGVHRAQSAMSTWKQCPRAQTRRWHMKRLMTVVLGLWFPVLGYAAAPATTFTGTTVENVDTAKQTLSIKTKDGQSWTLQVADPELLKKQNLKKGDQVSVEVDSDNKVIQIAKPETQTN